jgi:hypothetical protein
MVQQVGDIFCLVGFPGVGKLTIARMIGAVVVDNQRFESKQARDNHNAGWSAGLDRLTKIAR